MVTIAFTVFGKENQITLTDKFENIMQEIPNPNKCDKPKCKTKTKYGMPYAIGIGTLNKNPDVFVAPSPYKRRIWIWFEGCWYISNMWDALKTPEELAQECQTIIDKTYNREDFLSKLMELLC